MYTAFDKANSVTKKIKQILMENEVEIKVTEDNHHANSYEFSVTHDGIRVSFSVDDIIYQ